MYIVCTIVYPGSFQDLVKSDYNYMYKELTEYSHEQMQFITVSLLGEDSQLTPPKPWGDLVTEEIGQRRKPNDLLFFTFHL